VAERADRAEQAEQAEQAERTALRRYAMDLLARREHSRLELEEKLRRHCGKVARSRARGEGSRYADVDLLIEGPGTPRQMLGQIGEQLTDSNFPYKVDLVLEADLADSYRESVMADRVLLDATRQPGSKMP